MTATRCKRPKVQTDGICARILLLVVTGLVACAPQSSPSTVAVRGADYAFVLPDTITAGPNLISLDNIGEVRHEMAIARLKPGVTLAQVLETMEAGGDPEELVEEAVGVVFADPGQSSPGQLLVDLVSGSTYALMCFFQDEPDSPPHTALGMVASFEVPWDSQSRGDDE